MPVQPCSPTSPPAPGVVVFSASEFLASFPEFTAVNTAFPNVLQANFDRATLQVNNCCQSLADANTRLTLLYLVTAHITALFQGVNNAGPQGVVGRIADATEGSVSVGTEMSSEVSQSQAYYLQTPYGAEFWQASARYRTARYIAPRSGFRDPLPGPDWGFPYAGGDGF